MTDTLPKLGFIGTGLMGLPMTKRLLAAGYSVTVWNRTLSKAAPAVKAGAILGKSPKAVADAADTVLMCLTDAAAVEQVIFGPQGVAESDHPHYLVDFSSIRPEAAFEFAGRLRERAGIAWIDAPVSGGVDGAEAGTLAIMAGGEAADVDAVRPILAHLSQRVTHMGPSGTGQITKLVNQVIAGTTLAVVAEAVNFASRAGVDATRLTEALSGGFADSKPFQIFAPRMAIGKLDDPLGYLYTMLKDLDTAHDVAREAQAALPLASMASELLRMLASQGYAESDITALIKLYASPEA